MKKCMYICLFVLSVSVCHAAEVKRYQHSYRNMLPDNMYYLICSEYFSYEVWAFKSDFSGNLTIWADPLCDRALLFHPGNAYAYSVPVSEYYTIVQDNPFVVTLDDLVTGMILLSNGYVELCHRVSELPIEMGDRLYQFDPSIVSTLWSRLGKPGTHELIYLFKKVAGMIPSNERM